MYNKRILIGSPVLGFLITGAAFCVGPVIRGLGIDAHNGDMQPLLESIATNIGTAVFAFVFFYVAEKNLIHAVTSEQKESLRQARQDINTTRTELTNLRLSRRQQRARIMNAFDGQDLDPHTYIAFLNQAIEDRAFWGDSISVPASRSPGAYVLNFSLSEADTMLLTLKWGWNGISCAEAWGPQQSWVNVIDRLDQAAENWSKTEGFAWEMAVRRLPSAVKLADESVLSNAEGMLKGRPREFVGDDWALTTEGLERLSGGSGGLAFDSITTKQGGLFRRTEESPRPQGVDEQEWKYLLQLFDEALEQRELMSD